MGFSGPLLKNLVPGLSSVRPARRPAATEIMGIATPRSAGLTLAMTSPAVSTHLGHVRLWFPEQTGEKGDRRSLPTAAWMAQTGHSTLAGWNPVLNAGLPHDTNPVYPTTNNNRVFAGGVGNPAFRGMAFSAPFPPLILSISHGKNVLYLQLHKWYIFRDRLPLGFKHAPR
jgi:hypothetical protein